jgi:DNA-binding NarL/FixJ family response regulator
MSCKVLLADDSEVVRRAIRSRLSSQPGFEVVGETETFAETLRLVKILKPRIVVLDIHLKDFATVSPYDFCAQVEPHCEVIGISIFTDVETEILAKKLGVVKLIDKINLGEELIPTILELCKDDKAEVAN